MGGGPGSVVALTPARQTFRLSDSRCSEPEFAFVCPSFPDCGLFVTVVKTLPTTAALISIELATSSSALLTALNPSKAAGNSIVYRHSSTRPVLCSPQSIREAPDFVSSCLVELRIRVSTFSVNLVGSNVLGHLHHLFRGKEGEVSNFTLSRIQSSVILQCFLAPTDMKPASTLGR